MPVFQLDESLIFPHPVLREPDGLLAYGFDLDPDRLLLAYRWGIFPWFSPGQPALWWWTAPRPVIRPDAVHVSRSMRKVQRSGCFTITFNRAFGAVIRACAEIPRPDQEGTWITAEMIEAYTYLHADGFAHSVEVWDTASGELAGGLYGIGMGRIFFGESMFSRLPNASKAGFITLAARLHALGITCIDCQQDTPHMQTLGSFLLDDAQWLETLRVNHRYMLTSGVERYSL